MRKMPNFIKKNEKKNGFNRPQNLRQNLPRRRRRNDRNSGIRRLSIFRYIRVIFVFSPSVSAESKRQKEIPRLQI